MKANTKQEFIPYGKQNISEADIEAVVDVLRSDLITQGPVIPAFEQKIREYTGAAHASLVSSATAGLHLACMAAGLGPGKTLLTSPNTFVASSNAARYCGADVDFVDIDPGTYNMSVPKLREKLARLGEKVAVVMPVQFSGQSCPMEEIAALKKEYGFRVIEDASHAIGGRYKNEPVGGCRYSDATVFSFHPVKIITTGEGGAVTTNDDELGAQLARIRTHGVTRDQELMSEESHGPWYYQQVELGYNYRITDIQAALGLSQFARLDEFVSRRQQLADRYDELLANLPVRTPVRHPDSYSSFHLYVIRVDRSRVSKPHKQIFEELRAAGIGVQLHYIPVHLQPYYRGLGFNEGDFPEVEAYYSEAVSLPLFYDLSDAQQDRVVVTLADVLS